MCYPMVIARFLMTNAINQLLEHQNQNTSTYLIIGYLSLIKNLIQLLGYSDLFDLDEFLISTQIGSIEEIRVSEALKTDITYLLSLCEYGDLHLRGACANLLITLIQITNHLLTLSSLSNSFNNSFINQCSLVSTDSQDSSRLYVLMIIMHVHAFTIIGIKLLEDSIQHTTSSCILAQVSLAQLIDDIDFRILTYLEQQQKQLKQYILIYGDFQAAVLDLLVQLLLIRHFIYCIAEFLVMLSHETFHSKQVIKVQDLIKHYDSLLTSGHEPETHVIVNSVQIEDDK
ncbi:unnamed protein product [Rotaria sp. Silwood1]|nr:unnamed protein product [Rotaria sp. Silwood1]CAF1681405.1 unnamed protein product [Rotaria sp. Silwood1]